MFDDSSVEQATNAQNPIVIQLKLHDEVSEKEPSKSM